MSAQHTPAPWQLLEVGEFVTRPAVADSRGVSLLTVLDEEGTKFAAVLNEADADLIAAAPELLAALILAEPYVRAAGVLIHLGDDLATVQAAIAKATGTAP